MENPKGGGGVATTPAPPHLLRERVTLLQVLNTGPCLISVAGLFSVFLVLSTLLALQVVVLLLVLVCNGRQILR